MEMNPIQTANMISAAASALGKDKDEKKTGDEKEQLRRQNVLFRQMRETEESTQVKKSTKSYLA